ncbi:MAG: glycerol-3-phosphate 1-O-acyltransferase PlsY [Eubacteriales bacterium]|nr:glycerol-3-phosphate 1-O-acyltransferase PlsY [Eubacteriales bacterium]
MKLLFIILLGYLLGSIPFALVIGKVFYKTDIREHGSGNLGGSNAGRVLGMKAGMGTMAMDLLKVSAVVLIAKILDGSDTAMALGALAAGIGHCFPVFAGFRGGKAVANLYGFLFGLVAFAGRSWLYFLLPLLLYAVILYAGRMTSLSSMISSVAAAIYICLQPAESAPVKVVIVLYALLIVFRHRANIERIRNHNENKIHWLP